MEFIIVNSNVAEIGLLGSAYGRLTPEQMSRLQQMVAASSEPIVVVVMHHPICRWSDDVVRRFRANINRWAFLAHDSEEAERLPDLLCAAAPPTCRQLLLCSGHVHDIARAGSVVSALGRPAPDEWGRLTVLENPALPNVTRPKLLRRRPRAGDLLLCERTSDGRLRPARVSWPDLLGPNQGRAER